MRKWIAIAAVLAAGCGDQPGGGFSEEKAYAPPPRQVCDKARGGIEQLRGRPGIELGAPGEAIIEDAIWLEMGETGRDQFAQLLAYGLSCSLKDPPREQQVTIRSPEGRVLMQRLVQTGIDLSDALE